MSDNQKMAITQETIVLNDFAGSKLMQRTRTSGSGTKSRYTIQISAEPIIHNFSALELGRAPAEAIQKVIVKQIQAVDEDASDATVRKRENSARALAGAKLTAKGKVKAGSAGATVVRRYSGGRTGLMPPVPGSTKLFNDSGRLSKITIMPNRAYSDDAVWEVNVPANRLDPTTFGDMGQFQAMVTRLQRLVPALGSNTLAMLETDEVDKALRESIEFCLGQALVRHKDLKAALRKSQWEFASQLAGGYLNLFL